MMLTTQANTGNRLARLEMSRRRKCVTMTPLLSWEGTTSIDPWICETTLTS